MLHVGCEEKGQLDLTEATRMELLLPKVRETIEQISSINKLMAFLTRLVKTKAVAGRREILGQKQGYRSITNVILLFAALIFR